MSQASEPLADDDDGFGRLLLDYLEGRAGEPFLDRDDGSTGPAMGPERFFAEPERWAEAELAVFESVRSRVLDVGAGQVTIRIRYGERATPWFDLLLVSVGELERLAAPAGWRVAQAVEGEPPDFYAVLEKS